MITFKAKVNITDLDAKYLRDGYGYEVEDQSEQEFEFSLSDISYDVDGDVYYDVTYSIVIDRIHYLEMDDSGAYSDITDAKAIEYLNDIHNEDQEDKIRNAQYLKDCT